MEKLKELLGEELYGQLTEKLGDTKIDIVNNGQWIPKEKFNEVNTELKSTREQFDNAQKTLKDLEGKAGSADEYKTKLDEINAQFENYKQESETRLLNTQKKTALEKHLMQARADEKAVDLLANLFELDKIELDEKGTIKDWENVLKPIKEERSTLFLEEKMDSQKPNNGSNASGEESINQFRQAMGLPI